MVVSVFMYHIVNINNLYCCYILLCRPRWLLFIHSVDLQKGKFWII